MDTYLRPLTSGTVVHVDAATGRSLGPATPIPELADCGCPEFFRVPSGNPEPDGPDDCWREVTCGAPVFETYGNPNGRTCTDGHTYRGIEEEWRIDGWVDAVASRLGRDLDDHEAADIRDMVSR